MGLRHPYSKSGHAFFIFSYIRAECSWHVYDSIWEKVSNCIYCESFTCTYVTTRSELWDRSASREETHSTRVPGHINEPAWTVRRCVYGKHAIMDTHTHKGSVVASFIHAKIHPKATTTKEKQAQNSQKSIENKQNGHRNWRCVHTHKHTSPILRSVSVTLGLLCFSAPFLTASAEMKY